MTVGELQENIREDLRDSDFDRDSVIVIPVLNEVEGVFFKEVSTLETEVTHYINSEGKMCVGDVVILK